MKQIFLKDILGILKNNETVAIYDSTTYVGAFRTDRLLHYFFDSSILNREVKLLEQGNSAIYITLKSDKEKEN